MGLFDRLKQGLSKTREAISQVIAKVVAPGSKLDAVSMAAMETALLEADLGNQGTQEIMEALRMHQGEDARQALARTLENYITKAEIRGEDLVAFEPLAQPEVILFVGVNGAGKTTTLGKLAARFAQKGEKVVVAAGDTFRAGAREQLELWADRAKVAFFSGSPGGDPAALAFDAIAHAKAQACQRVFIDTAGRLQNRQGLMDELKKVHRVCGKAMPGAPHRVILVLDGSQGQNMIRQAKIFTEAVGVSHLVVTKLDGTSKAGALLPIGRELKIPIAAIGVGEGLEDLQPFNPASFARALAGLEEVDS
jgi:fused signal recognition particle receptor